MKDYKNISLPVVLIVLFLAMSLFVIGFFVGSNFSTVKFDESNISSDNNKKIEVEFSPDEYGFNILGTVENKQDDKIIVSVQKNNFFSNGKVNEENVESFEVLTDVSTKVVKVTTLFNGDESQEDASFSSIRKGDLVEVFAGEKIGQKNSLIALKIRVKISEKNSVEFINLEQNNE